MTTATPTRRTRRRNRGSDPTIRDVARAAGVSSASVSRALTRPEMVAEATRVRVLKVAAQLSYTLPRSATPGDPSRLIGMVLGRWTNATSGIIGAIDARLADAGYVLCITTVSPSRDAVACAQALKGAGTSALVLLDLEEGSAGLARQSTTPLPCVELSRQPKDFDTLVESVTLAVRYLRSLGHCKIVAFGDVDGLPGALQARGLPVSAVSLDRTSVDLASDKHAVAEAFRKMMLQGEPPTSVVCDSDVLAAMLMEHCCARGLAIPGDMSVVGLGDTPLAQSTVPTLSSIRPAGRLGTQIANHVLRLLTEFAPRATLKEVGVKMVVRASTGVPT
jgi:LacI family transcriptional regulator